MSEHALEQMSAPPEPSGTGETFEEGSGDTVVCVMSGQRIPRAEAVMVTLGPGRRRWVRRALTRLDGA